VVGQYRLRRGRRRRRPLQDEDQALEPLVKRALLQRPEISNLAKQRTHRSSPCAPQGRLRAQLAATAAGSYAGTDLEKLVPNWSIGATLTWPILSGWQTQRVVHEAEANLENIDAEVEAEQLQIGFDVQQAWLGWRANKASLGASQEALINAKEAASPGRRALQCGDRQRHRAR